MKEKFGCSFQFLDRNETQMNGNQNKECKVKDVKEKIAFRDNVYGNILISAILFKIIISLHKVECIMDILF